MTNTDGHQPANPVKTASEESARLRALERYAQLDTAPEQAYDDITRVAAAICGTPIALITLLDAHRQWFKSRVGLEATETPRHIAFCDHTIRTRQMMEVPDAARDERFHNNPLVTGAPYIRFYAGVPLTTPDGHRLGALCVIDRKPRRLAAEQKAALESLARQVVLQFELEAEAEQRRQAEAALQQMNSTLQAQVEEQTAELRQSSESLQALAVKLQRIREEERSRISREIHDQLGQMLTALKLDLSLLGQDLQSPPARESLPRLQQDVAAMLKLTDDTLGSVRRIAQELRPEILDTLGLVPALEWLLKEMLHRHGIAGEVRGPNRLPELTPQAQTQLFRIVQEALTNVVRHAEAGRVLIEMAVSAQRLHMSIVDDGRGIDSEDSMRLSLGLLGMRERAQSIGGTLELERVRDGGTRVGIELPIQETPE